MHSSVRFLRLAAAAAAASAFAPARPAAADVIHPGTTAWAATAKTGRADLVVLGDSVVWHNGNGWDAGFNAALSDKVGLAGTGVATGTGWGVEGYYGGTFPLYGTAWAADPARVPAGLAGYNVDGAAWSIGSAADGGYRDYMAAVDPTRLRPGPDGAYQWTLYAAGTGRTGGGYARVYPPGTVFATALADLPVQTPSAGLQKLTITLPAPGPGFDPTVGREYRLNNPSDMTLFYSRVAGVGAAGATVSSWGYGGRTTLDFLRDKWGTLSSAGRRAWLDALVDGGSGKLNVVIAEGLNDRNDARASADGVNPGNSPAGFAANVRALIASVRAEWSAAGHAVTDLSFTLLGMYQDAYEPADGTGALRRLGGALADVAAADPQVSFVDLWDKAGTYQQGVAQGYFFDESHPSLTGVTAYSGMVVDALFVPEPAVATAVGLAGGVGLLGRRRRRQAVP